MSALKKIVLYSKSWLLEAIEIARKVIDEVSVAISFLIVRTTRSARIDFRNYRKLNLPNWYHDFSAVGIRTRRFRDGAYDLSQEDKEPVVIDYLEQAARIVNERKSPQDGPSSLVDLFCADAYYSIFALHRGLFQSAVGVDFEEKSGEGFVRGGVLDQAETIAALCGLQHRLVLNNSDVMDYTGTFDLCLCVGGLYHIADPAGLLKRITSQTRHALVIQTVIPSNVGEDAPFFVTPAPNWTWGCRFNKKYLLNVLEELGWLVSKVDVRPLRANIHEWDKLSLSLLCVKSDRRWK